MFHCIHGNYDQIRDNPALVDCMIFYFYNSMDVNGPPARLKLLSLPKKWQNPKLGDKFAVHYNHYPTELANYYVLRELNDAMMLVCGPNTINSMRYYCARDVLDKMMNTRTRFNRVEPSEIHDDSHFNTRFYLTNSESNISRLANSGGSVYYHRGTGMESKAIKVTQDIMENHIGIHQNALYQKDHHFDQPLVRMLHLHSRVHDLGNHTCQR